MRLAFEREKRNTKTHETLVAPKKLIFIAFQRSLFIVY